MTPFEFSVEFEDEYAAIPPLMQEAIRRYIVQGIAPGQFLSAVIKNDLFGAVGHADATNEPLIKLYVQWFYNKAPGNCYGSPESMREWMTTRQQAVATMA